MDNPQENAFPRTYYLRKFNAVYYYFLISACVLLSALFLLGFALEIRQQKGLDTITSGIFVLAVMGFCIYQLKNARNYKITLYKDAIEKDDYRLMRSEIAGYRVIKLRKKSSYISFVPLDTSKPVFKMRTILLDDILKEWIRPIPNLDLQDLKKSLEDIAQDNTLGTTSDERLSKIKSGKKLAGMLTVTAVILAFIGTFYPYKSYPLVVVLSIFPFVAILVKILSPHVFRLYQQRNNARPGLFGVLVFPGIGLLMHAAKEYYVVDVLKALALAVIPAAIISMATVKELRGQEKALKKYFGLLLFLLPYGYGNVVEANAILDNGAEVSSYKVMVARKHSSFGRGGSHYYLRLEPWGNITVQRDMSVSYALYDHIGNGDSICIRMHPGALGVAWYIPTACDNPEIQ